MVQSRALYLIGLSLLCLYACIAIVPALFFLIDIPIHSFQFPLAFLVSFFCIWVLQKKVIEDVSVKQFLANTGITLSLFILTIIFAKNYYDTSFDGNWYHMDAVYNLSAGWNPVYEQLRPEQTTYCESYLNHFPKLSWHYSACINVFFGNIEAGKSSTLLLIIACLFVWQYVAKEALKFTTFNAWLFALVIASNPVQLLNLLSFYTDGQLSALFSLAVAFFVLYVFDRSKINLLLTLLALALLANYKFTSAIYAGILAFGVFGFCWQQKVYPPKKLLVIFAGWCIAAYCIIGFSPYVTNTLHNGNPLYPLSESSTAVFSKQAIYPANFLSMNWPERFFSSIFAEPSWARNPDESHIKQLFHQTNLNSYSGGIPDLAAFGPMFPEALVILLPFFLVGCFLIARRSLLAIFMLMGIISLTIIINPEAWLLRYVPQFWLIIVAMLYVLWVQPKLKYIAWLLAFSLLLNNYMMLREYIQANSDKTTEQNNKFALIKNNKLHYQVYPGWTRSFKNRLGANGIDTAHLVWISDKDSASIIFEGSLGARFRKIVK